MLSGRATSKLNGDKLEQIRYSNSVICTSVCIMHLVALEDMMVGVSLEKLTEELKFKQLFEIKKWYKYRKPFVESWL